MNQVEGPNKYVLIAFVLNQVRFTDYREEFGKFRIFLAKKVPKLNNFRVNSVNFLGEKGRFGCLLRS